MSQAPGSYVLISLKVSNTKGKNELVVDYSQIAYMIDDTTPTIAVNPGQKDITLPPNSNRPFAFVVRYDTSKLGADYTWDSRPNFCVAIAEVGAQPIFGNPLPNGFIGPKQGGGEITFIDPNNTNDKKQYTYWLRMVPLAGGDPLILDPRIVNG